MIVAGYAMRESVRRRVFPVVLVLTVAFLGLYGFGVYKAYESIDPNATESIGNGAENALVDTQVLFSATLFGLSICTTRSMAPMSIPSSIDDVETSAGSCPDLSSASTS